MDKKPHNYLLLVLLFMNLLIGMMFTYMYVTFNQKGFKVIAKNINIPLYLKSEKEIYAIIEEKKIPIEVFNYIDKREYDKQVDLYFDKKEVSKEKINGLLSSSINEYEKINMVDVYSNIENDVDNITEIIYSKINDTETRNKINTIIVIGNISYIFNIISTLITIFLFVKYKDFLYSGISYVGVSIVIFLSLRNEIIYNLKDYLNIDGINYLNNNLSNICSIYFVIGIIILTIFLLFKIDYIFKYVKRSRIDYEWRYK